VQQSTFTFGGRLLAGMIGLRRRNGALGADIAPETLNALSCPCSPRQKGSPLMSDAHVPVTTDLLQAFADAWNRHDANAIMSFMTDDCVFEASAGPDICGERSEGRESVRAAFAKVWATFPDAHWGNARHFVCGDRGVSEWIFTGTRHDGAKFEVHGCDLFTFREGRILVKNSYRKNRPPLPEPPR